MYPLGKILNNNLRDLQISHNQRRYIMSEERIQPSEKISKEIMQVIQQLDKYGNNKKLLGYLVKLGVRKFIQELLEQKVKEYIGTDYYKRESRRNGYRNGYKTAYLKTAEKKIPIAKPQVSNSPESFKSSIWTHIKGHTEQLEKIAVEMYAKGCSTRDIEELLKDEHGHILLSKSAISHLNKILWKEYEDFCNADLSGYDVVYIFCDAVYESLRLHRSGKEGILVVWGILSSGSKVLLSMRLSNKESYEDWLEVFRDLRNRGFRDPVLGVTDGAPGLIQAFKQAFPHTLRQRCLVDKKRNILNKVSSGAVSEVKAFLNSIYYVPDRDTAMSLAQAFRNKFGNLYPSAVRSFDEDLSACLSHLESMPILVAIG